MPDKLSRCTVKCLMMATIDGKIGSRNANTDVVDDYLDIYRDIDASIAGNAWMCGRITTKLYFAKNPETRLPSTTRTITGDDFVGDLQEKRYYVTVDPRGSLRWQNSFISFYPEHGKLQVIVIVTRKTPKDYLGYLKDKGIPYIFAGNSEVDFAEAMQKLTALFAIDTLLLEGGAQTNGSMLTAGCIDELYLLIIPRVLNEKDAPSVFGDANVGKISPITFMLRQTEPKPQGTVLLHYTK